MWMMKIHFIYFYFLFFFFSKFKFISVINDDDKFRFKKFNSEFIHHKSIYININNLIIIS